MARNRLNEPTGAFAVRAPPGRESRALKCVPRALAHIFVRQLGIWCSHTRRTPVLREAHMTRFTKMFAAVSGAVAIGLVGVSAFLTSPASTQASTYEAAQINPDQITRNAPRDLPSFEQKYQMHTGVLDTLRR
jgi:hypothetical protein